jgi:hypothetical protein
VGAPENGGRAREKEIVVITSHSVPAGEGFDIEDTQKRIQRNTELKKERGFSR